MTGSMDILMVGDLVSSSSSDYKIQAFLGSGSFGSVLQCLKAATNETVALKALNSWTHEEQAEEEMSILKRLKDLGCGGHNIICLGESFTFRGRFFLEFEKMDISLCQFIHRRRNKPLSLMEIRPIVQQLAKALDFLKGAGIAHADLKPANIMMVEHKQQPLKVKIIDFGLALSNPAKYRGVTFGTRWYRAPEIILGTPFNEAIDVWSLGCTAAEMLMGSVLFPGFDEYDMMRHISLILGEPSQHMLSASLYAPEFFTLCLIEGERRWRLKSILEARNYNITRHSLISLSDLMKCKVSPKLSGKDLEADEWDRGFFIDLLRKTLKVDYAERITPSEILQHPFITMSHLGSFVQSPHVKKGVELMAICEDERPKEKACPDGSAPHSDPPERRPAGPSGSKESTIIPPALSSSRKRKRDGEDGAESGKRTPNATSVKKARTESKDAAQTEAGGKTSPPKSSLQKRKLDDAEVSELICPPKKRSVDLSEQLVASVNKVISGPEAASPSLTQVSHPLKRKRRRDDEDGAESGKRNPNATSVKKARTESKDAAQTEAGGKTSPPKSSLQKRKLDDAEVSELICPPKKRSVDLSEQLVASVNKVISGPEAASPSLTQVGQPLKRKRRRDEEAASASGSAGDQTSSAKMRRRVVGGETCLS